jgi:hypothetical protein
MRSGYLSCIFLLIVMIALPVRQPETGATPPESQQTFIERRPPKGPFHGLTLRLFGLKPDKITQDLVSELLLTDPQGRRTGRDPITGTEYEEIPDSAYVDEPVVRPKKELEISGLLDGSYVLQVIGTDRGSYNLYVRPLGENGLSPNHTQVAGIPTAPGVIHAYRLEYTRIPGIPMKVWGNFDGGGEALSEAEGFLTYASPTGPQTEIGAKRAGFPLVILYGPTVLPKTFKATLDSTDISSHFKPVPCGYQVIPLKFSVGSHTLMLSVQGKTSAGEMATDIDRLVFLVP